MYDNEYKIYYTVGINSLDAGESPYIYETIGQAKKAQSIATKNQQYLKELREKVTSNPKFKEIMDEWASSKEYWKIDLPEEFYKFFSLAFYRRKDKYSFYDRLYKDLDWTEYDESLCFYDENHDSIENNYAPVPIASYVYKFGDSDWTEEDIINWFHKKLDDKKLCKQFDLYIEKQNVLRFEGYYIIMKELD